MSANSILIFHDMPIINGFVQVPPNQEADKNRVTVTEALLAIAGSVELELPQGSGKPTGWKVGAQAILRLPGLIPGTSYATNPVDALANS